MGEFGIDWDNWRNKPKPFGFSGCFRLRNESQFMEVAIKSHLSWLDEAVLVVQPSDDDTIKKAYRMADQDKRVKVYEYPFECDWIDTPEFVTWFTCPIGLSPAVNIPGSSRWRVM
jgi:hypothetical protein